ncbi:MAG: hypothetical protein BWY45_01886 [Euryarchaeota archaeon ADurb.Bin294]|nr:MAG: hypothetical protein BWY45_01886 [Euryarchaeota archaeon ADurb.Bin294]
MKHLVLDIKIQFTGEKTAQVFVDKEIGGGLVGIGRKVPCKQSLIILLWGECLFQRCIREGIEHRPDNLFVQFLLHIPGAISFLLIGVKSTKYQPDGQFLLLRIILLSCLRVRKKEVPVCCLHIILGCFCLHCPKPDGILTDPEGRIGKELTGLDVVLVLVCPVKENLFTVVGNSILLSCRIPAKGHEITLLVVPGEERVNMGEDERTMLTGNLRGQIRAGIPDLVRKGLGDELLNFSPLLIHDPVDTVVQLIIGLELEELA